MKQKLLEAIAEARRKERDLAALCTDIPPDPSGTWRPQDHLAHLTWVREDEATLIEAVSAGAGIPPEPAEGRGDRMYLAKRDQTAAEVIAAAERSWDRLESVIARCTEEDLRRDHPHRQGRRLVESSPGDHLGAHLMWCHLEAGHEEAAEAVQLWARELNNRVSDDPSTRAVATYNLACFYARVARPADALPLLHESFEASPSLQDWARKDPDLDPIRDDPRVKELLAT